MPGCSHSCRICADTQTLVHGYIHSGQIHEWAHAHAYTTHTRARARTCARTHAYTFWNAYVQREFISYIGGGMKVHVHPVCLVFFFEKKKRTKKSVQKNMTQICFLLLLFFFFCFTVVSGQSLRSGCMKTASYPPCNQVYKRSQQNACTHWSTPACDVIHHPKTTFARWLALPTKLICLKCRFALRSQYSILYSGWKFHSSSSSSFCILFPSVFRLFSS